MTDDEEWRGDRVRAAALAEGLTLLRAHIAAGLVKLTPKLAAIRAVELARLFERFLLGPGAKAARRLGRKENRR